mgnify:CR=1 FL=1
MERYKEKIAGKIRVDTDIPFAQVTGHDSNPETLCLDIYSPEEDTEKNRRVIILIHGGGFRNCTKQQEYIVTLANELAGYGYVCVSVDYRLYKNDETHPGRKIGAISASEDVELARLFLCENADRLGIDMKNAALLGGSAGGMTVNEACKNKAAGYRAAVCLWGGPDEITDPHMYTDMLLVHGTDDRLVPYENSVKLHKALSEASVYSELITLEGAGHTAIDRKDEFLPRVIEFLDERMK